MIQFANKTDLILFSAFANDNTVNAEKVSPITRNLGDLARLNYIRGKLIAVGDLVSGTGHEINVIIKDNGTQVAVATLNAANNWGESVEVDLSSISGTAGLTASVFTVAAGGVVNVSAWLEVEHPVVISA